MSTKSNSVGGLLVIANSEQLVAPKSKKYLSSLFFPLPAKDSQTSHCQHDKLLHQKCSTFLCLEKRSRYYGSTLQFKPVTP